MKFRTRTIQDRVPDHPALDALARLNAKVERALYVELRKGRAFTGDLAKTFYQGHGVSAKNLDHIHNTLQGRLDGVRECAKLQVETLKAKIKAKRTDIARQTGNHTRALNALEKARAKRVPDPGVVAKHCADRDRAAIARHRHKRRLAVLEDRLGGAVHRAADPKLCFGSREFLRERNWIDLDDVEALAAWRAEWDRRRHLEVFVPGTARAPCGNEFVRLEETDDGWNVVLRLPEALRAHATSVGRAGGVEIREVVVGHVRFPHGSEALRRALADHSDGRRAPVTWRFQRHVRGGWMVSCTLQEALPDLAVPDFAHGALGVDFNADHLALTLTDERGCLRRTWSVPFDTRGGSSEHNLDAARKAALEIARIALKHHVSVVVEDLDFQAKKAAVTTGLGPDYARMLHSLGYTLLGRALESACARHGVRLERVNPAYTSLIGHAKFSRTYGADVHHAAACAIARRGQRFSERVPAQVGIMLTAGVHGTLPRPETVQSSAGPERISQRGTALPIPARRHVWAQWAAVARGRKTCVRSFLWERVVKARGGGHKAAAPGPAAQSPAKGSDPASAITGLWIAAAPAS